MIRLQLLRPLIAATAASAAVGFALPGLANAQLVRRQPDPAEEVAQSLRATHDPWLTAVPAHLSYTWKIIQHQDPDPAHLRAELLDERRAMIYHIRVQAPDRVRVECPTGTGLLIAGGKAWKRSRAGQIEPVPVADHPVLDYAHGVAFYPALRAFVEQPKAFDALVPSPMAAAPPVLRITMHPVEGNLLGCFVWGASTGLFDTHGGELRYGAHAAGVPLDNRGRPTGEVANTARRGPQATLGLSGYRALPGDRWAPMAAQIATLRRGDDRLVIRLEFQIVGEDVWLLRQAQYLRGSVLLDEVTISDVSLDPIDEKLFDGPEALRTRR